MGESSEHNQRKLDWTNLSCNVSSEIDVLMMLILILIHFNDVNLMHKLFESINNLRHNTLNIEVTALYKKNKQQIKYK